MRTSCALRAVVVAAACAATKVDPVKPHTYRPTPQT